MCKLIYLFLHVGSNEEAMLEQAVAMSLATDSTAPASTAPSVPDFASMTEEEQIAYAMQMSLQQTRNSFIFIFFKTC